MRNKCEINAMVVGTQQFIVRYIFGAKLVKKQLSLMLILMNVLFDSFISKGTPEAGKTIVRGTRSSAPELRLC